MIVISNLIIAAIVAVVAPSPSPAGAQRVLPVIVTVTSSPYCNSLADNFNGALLQMLANDRQLDAASVQLDDLNQVFYQTNYVQQYLHVRDALGRQETALNGSLAIIAHHIAELRAGGRLTTDPKATAAIQSAVNDLQTAYDHQRQLAIDLQSLYVSMLRYNIARANPPMGGFGEQEMLQPPAMRDVKSYLHFDNQRRIVAASEDQAVDVAYGAAQSYCTPKK